MLFGLSLITTSKKILYWMQQEHKAQKTIVLLERSFFT